VESPAAGYGELLNECHGDANPAGFVTGLSVHALSTGAVRYRLCLYTGLAIVWGRGRW